MSRQDPPRARPKAAWRLASAPGAGRRVRPFRPLLSGLRVVRYSSWLGFHAFAAGANILTGAAFGSSPAWSDRADVTRLSSDATACSTGTDMPCAGARRRRKGRRQARRPGCGTSVFGSTSAAGLLGMAPSCLSWAACVRSPASGFQNGPHAIGIKHVIDSIYPLLHGLALG